MIHGSRGMQRCLWSSILCHTECSPRPCTLRGHLWHSFSTRYSALKETSLYLHLLSISLIAANWKLWSSFKKGTWQIWSFWLSSKNTKDKITRDMSVSARFSCWAVVTFVSPALQRSRLYQGFSICSPRLPHQFDTKCHLLVSRWHLVECSRRFKTLQY